MECFDTHYVIRIHGAQMAGDGNVGASTGDAGGGSAGIRHGTMPALHRGRPASHRVQRGKVMRPPRWSRWPPAGVPRWQSPGPDAPFASRDWVEASLADRLHVARRPVDRHPLGHAAGRHDGRLACPRPYRLSADAARSAVGDIRCTVCIPLPGPHRLSAAITAYALRIADMVFARGFTGQRPAGPTGVPQDLFGRPDPRREPIGRYGRHASRPGVQP